MDTLKIAICEDSAMEYQLLVSLIDASGVPCAYERFETGDAFLAQFYPGKYDFILMDIYMEGLSGVETVSKLRERDDSAPVAFITTSLDHAMDGYRLRVGRYLHKPLQRAEVEEALRFALQEKKNLPGLSLSTRQGERYMPFRHIRYAEQSNHDLTVFLTGNRTLIMRERLDNLERRLPSPPFFRCHKSYLVNLLQVRYLNRELYAFEMNEGGAAYIRRASLREAAKALERALFDETRNF